MKRKGVHIGWLAAGWLALVAVGGGVGLAWLRGWHGKAVHEAAAAAVGERGRRLAVQMAATAGGASESDRWEGFAEAVGAARTAEPALEYVEVRKGGAVVFVDGGEESLGAAGGGWKVSGEVRMERERVAGGEGAGIPVVAFSARAGKGDGGEEIGVTVGLRRAAVEREERAAREAVESTYRMSLWGLGVGLGISVAVVAWALRREERRERERRREEHLAFSGALANGIVHDFRNPMSSLRLDAQMLEREASGAGRAERIGELAGRMRHTLDRMERVFREFSTLARPGGAGGGPASLRAGDVLRECAEMLAPRAEAAGVEVSVVADGAGPGFRASEAGAKRAAMNLILNAIQHAGAGGKVEARAEERPGGGARMVVRNTGDRIRKRDRKRVFELFYTTRPEGTGLGLFLARAAVERDGGKVSLLEERETGEGWSTGFAIEYPGQARSEESGVRSEGTTVSVLRKAGEG